VEDLKKRLEVLCNHPLNVCLLNWYQDGKHHINWHSDSEAELMENAYIASMSLGSTRKFRVKHKDCTTRSALKEAAHLKRKNGAELTEEEKNQLEYNHKKDPDRMEWQLGHGDLILMGGAMQKYYMHSVPKETVEVGPRINLTFRYVNPQFLT